MGKWDEMTEEEEQRHARRGAWCGLFLLPFLLLCICGIFAVTPGGRTAFDELVLQFSRDGIPYAEGIQISYTRGFTGAARASCALDRQNPKPANFQAAQDQLEEEYDTLVNLYFEYWQSLKSHGGDTTQYDPPDDTPSEIFSGRLRYCQ